MLKTFFSILLALFTAYLLLINYVLAIDVSIKEGAVPQALLQLNVLDVEETWLDDKKALAIVFSHKLSKALNYSNFVTATVNGVSLKGNWTQANDPHRIYLSDIKPNKKYEIFIRPGIASTNGLKLLKPKHFNILTQAVPASIESLNAGKSFSTQDKPIVQFRSTGIQQYDARLYHLNNSKHSEFIAKLQQLSNFSNWKVADISRFSDFVQKSSITIEQSPEQRVVTDIHLQKTSQPLAVGLYFISLKARTFAGEQINQLFYFSITDIAIHIDNLPNSTEIVTFSKTEAHLLPKVEFTLISPAKVTEAMTDQQGRGYFYLSDMPYASWVLIQPTSKQPQQFALQKIPLRKKVYHDMVMDTAHIFLNKKNYTVGERIDFSILLRDKDNKAIADQLLYIRLLDDKQRLISEQAIVTPELGSVSNFFQLPTHAIKDQPLENTSTALSEKARWSLQVYHSEADEDPLSTAEFYVGATDYLHAQLNIMTDNTLLTVDNNVPFVLKGYVDEKISPENLKVVIQRQIDWQPFASLKYKKFHFGSAVDKTLQGKEVLQTLRLDQQGQAEFSLPKIKNTLHSVLSVTLHAEMELAKQAIARESETLNYWPADKMVGVYWHSDDKQKTAQNFEFIYINQANELLAAQDIIVKVFKLGEQSDWVYSPESGWKKFVDDSRKLDPLIEEHTLVWEKGQKGKLSLELSEGSYRLEITNPQTNLRTDYVFSLEKQYALENFPPNHIELSLNKVCYQHGEVAILNIESPIDADALIRIASDKVHWSKQLRLNMGETQVEIPLNNKLVHKEQLITVLAFDKELQPNHILSGKIKLKQEAVKTPLQIETVHTDNWQALEIYAEHYKNMQAILVLSRIQKDEVLLPEIMPFIQSVSFDEDGYTVINNSEAKIDPKQQYHATLYFTDRVINALDVVFTSPPQIN